MERGDKNVLTLARGEGKRRVSGIKILRIFLGYTDLTFMIRGKGKEVQPLTPCCVFWVWVCVWN
jgi:hypothetical protein